jgi:hypothetical protein
MAINGRAGGEEGKDESLVALLSWFGRGTSGKSGRHAMATMRRVVELLPRHNLCPTVLGGRPVAYKMMYQMTTING